MTAPRITAVVVVHGSPAGTVAACVESLLASIDVDVHVVLVDNASPDAGAACSAWGSHERVTLVTSAVNGGFAAGVNQGLQLRRDADLVFLLNDDATIAPDGLKLCVDTLLEHRRAIAIAPRVMLANQTDRIDSIGVVLRPNGEAFNAFIGQPWSGQVATGDEVLGPCFGAALCRAEAFDPAAVGLIDERYRLYYEDIDWGLRARRAGWSTIACTEAVVLHQHAASTRQMGEAARYELVQRNLLLCVAKNFPARAAIHAWISRLVVHAKGLVTGPYRVQRLRSIARAVVALPSALAARRRLGRGTFDADATFRFAEGQSPNFSTDTYRPLLD